MIVVVVVVVIVVVVVVVVVFAFFQNDLNDYYKICISKCEVVLLPLKSHLTLVHC